MNCSLPGSPVHGISLARILEWVATSFSKGSFQPRDQTCVSCISGAFFTVEPLGEAPLVIREMKIKTTMIHFIPMSMAITKIWKITSVGEDAEKLVSLYIDSGTIKWCSS